MNLGQNGKHKEHVDTEYAETCNVWTRSIEYGGHLHFAPNNVWDFQLNVKVVCSDCEIAGWTVRLVAE